MNGTGQKNLPYIQYLREYGLIFISGIFLWILYAVYGTGADYNVCYTWMVQFPERLKTVADYPWTLNPPWLAIFMAPFVAIPGRAGYIVFLAFTIIAVIYGTRFFKGKTLLVLLSAQMSWVFYWGQVEAFAVLGLVMAKIALQNKSWGLMFLALVLASFKPQIGFLPVIAYWWWIGYDRWKPLVGMVLLVALSLWIWGPWPVWYMEGILKFAGDHHADSWNASIGIWALPLLIPALLVPLDREKRIIAITSTALLISPYLPYYSTVILLIQPIPVWAYLFAFNGYLPNLIGTTLAWNLVTLLPITVLAWLYWPGIKQLISRTNKKLAFPKADA